jgi:1,4-dihydroxy-2-naphthoate octaprenyltransferase
MPDRNTILLLRIPFSFLLMPVFLFALSEAPHFNFLHTTLLFVILHLCVYPASNGYNSFMDRDETSIGGLENPPLPDRRLYYTTLVLDLLAVALASIIDLRCAAGVLMYSLVSRAYSYRGIRLKKHAVISYITVACFQGYFVYQLVVASTGAHWVWPEFWDVHAIAATFLIGGVYPLTQVYQHEPDARRGDQSISMKLGYNGTFILTAVMFTVATALLYSGYAGGNRLTGFFILQVFMLPVVVCFVVWWCQVRRDVALANYRNTMRMNILSATSMNACFLVLIILHSFL